MKFQADLLFFCEKSSFEKQMKNESIRTLEENICLDKKMIFFFLHKVLTLLYLIHSKWI